MEGKEKVKGEVNGLGGPLGSALLRATPTLNLNYNLALPLDNPLAIMTILILPLNTSLVSKTVLSTST